MDSKIKKIIIASSLIICLLVGAGIYKTQLGNDQKKRIDVTILVEGELVYEDTIKTQARTLGEFLKEVDEFKVEMEDGPYGSFIVGMGVNELYYQDENQGLYWSYHSDNNQQCVKADFCDASDQLVIEDQDRFVFTLEKWHE